MDSEEIWEDFEDDAETDGGREEEDENIDADVDVG